MYLPFLSLPLYFYQISHLWLLCRASLPSSFLASIRIDSASLLKLLCTELLQHFWRKNYCVIQLNVSSAFSTAAKIFFLDIPSYMSFFVWPLFKISFVTHPPFSCTSPLFSFGAYLVYLVSWSQSELPASHLPDVTLCLLPLSVQTYVSASLSFDWVRVPATDLPASLSAFQTLPMISFPWHNSKFYCTCPIFSIIWQSYLIFLHIFSLCKDE